MILPEFQPHYPPARFAAERDIQTAYIVFGHHHVALRLSLPELAPRIASTFGAMLTGSPSGVPAGRVEIASHPDGISIAESANLDQEVFVDPDLAVRNVFHRTVKQFIAARPDLLWVHGGVVAQGGRALLFSASSGQGKSSLVALLIARGWTYLSDEIAAIDPHTATVLPFPVTPYRRIGGGQNLAPDEVRALDKIKVDVAPHAVVTTAVPLARAYFLYYHPPATTAVSLACPPGLAVLEMLRNSLSTRESREQEIAGLCQLMARIPSRFLRHANPRDAADLIAQSNDD